jgi:hypothetical protein
VQYSKALPKESFITDYAATKPMVNFAETFMVYLLCSGRESQHFKHPSFIEKWTFIRKSILRHKGCLKDVLVRSSGLLV